MAAINPFPIRELRQLKPKPIKGLDISKGTVEFRARENFPWGDKKFNVLLNVCEDNNLGNNVAIIKNEQNNLLVIYNSVKPTKVSAQIKYDVSLVNPSKTHHIAVTWSIKNRELILYFDGKQVIQTEIKV